MTIRDLEPKLIWEQFDDITRVPRPSKKEAKIIAWLIEFAQRHNIEYQTDQTGNVVMRKPATAGYESRPAVILQSHMDMVCESNEPFDFENTPISTRVDGEWVWANGTTLGADNGIGMAGALAALVDDTLVHGPLEALFTVDEETGAVVAAQIDAAQQKVAFDMDGVAGETDLRTKTEKEFDYNMVAFGGAVKEWFEQVDAFETWMNGKTVADVTGMEFTENSHGYTDTPAAEDLKASCTISMTAFLNAIQKAADAAK